jgi:protein involved in polysaccharide export with SLBB domain
MINIQFDSVLKLLKKTSLLMIFLTAAISSFAQLPADVKNIKVDELSDAQIKQYILESEKSGIPEPQQEALALKNGMPASELQKLKDRVARIRSAEVGTATPSSVSPGGADKVIVIDNSKAEQSAPIASPPPPPAAVAKQEAEPIKEAEMDPTMIYGHHLFKNNNLQFFEKASDVKAPDSYVLGSNDELTISVFGYSYFNEVLKIDAKGAINPTNIGSIMIKGMEYGKAKSLIRSKFSQHFDLTNNQITITLSYSRVINVNFVGEVTKPGSYKIPALNTAFNALIAVGGPSKLGSVRNIQIRRNGNVIKVLDVYEYLNNPNSKQDFYLEDNDYIYISPATKIVSISGVVRRPMLYELKGKENLDDLIRYAGGLKATAYTQLIKVVRIMDDGTQKQILNISLDSLRTNKKTFELKEADYIEIGEKLTEVRQFVGISGAVFRPGSYQFVRGERILDLIKKADGLRKEAKLDKAYLIRTNADKTKDYFPINLAVLIDEKKSDTTENMLLTEGDLLRVASVLDFVDPKKVSIGGALRNPGTFDYFKGMKLTDLVFIGEGLKEDANKKRAFLVRVNPDFTRSFLSINIEDAINFPEDTTKNILLERGDALTVVSVTDYIDKTNVSTKGLFRNPGSFEFYKGIRLYDLILLSGGLREEVNTERAFLVRTNADFTKNFLPINIDEVINFPDDSTKNLFLERGDALTVVSRKDFIDAMSINAVGLFRKPGTFDFANGMTLSDLIFVAGGLKMEADLLNIEVSRISFFDTSYTPGEPSRVVIKIFQVGKDTKLADDQLNFKLNPYDQVFVRMVPDFELPRNLTINGEVKYPGVYSLTSKDEHLDDLIKRAGGLNRFSFAEGATLYRPQLAGGYVVMNLKSALRNHKSKYNYIVKEGDVITIPRVIDVISIRGDVEYLNVINQEQVNAPYVQGKRANYYIKEFANGFTKTSFKRKTYVVENNSKVNRTRNYVIFKVYPKVKKGSVVYVVTKPVKEKEEARKKAEPVDWSKVIERTTVKITGLITLYLLLRTVSAN